MIKNMKCDKAKDLFVSLITVALFLLCSSIYALIISSEYFASARIESLFLILLLFSIGVALIYKES